MQPLPLHTPANAGPVSLHPTHIRPLPPATSQPNPSEDIHSDAWNDALQRLDRLDMRKQKAYNSLSEEQKGVLRSSTDAGAIGKLLLKAIDGNQSVKRLLKLNTTGLQPFYQFEKSLSQAVQTNAAI